MTQCVILLGDRTFVADLPSVPDAGNVISLDPVRRDLPRRLFVTDVALRVDNPTDGIQTWSSPTTVITCREYRRGDEAIALQLKRKRV